MPIFEYQCEKCGRVLNFLVRNLKNHVSPTCPKCGHPKMQRLFSRFAAVGARKSKADSADPGDGPDTAPGGEPDLSMLNGLDENDPRSLGRAMRAMASETGEAMPPEMDEVCRRLESGEDPEKIEETMGDLLGENGPGAPAGGPPDNTLYDA